MNEILVMLVLLVNQGYWYAGGTQSFTLQPNLGEWPQGAVAGWVLALGEVEVARGEQQLDGDKTQEIAVAVPEVRIATRMLLHVTLSDGDGKVLEQVDRVVHIFPAHLRVSSAPRFWKGRQILLVGETRLERDLAANTPAPQVLSDVQRLQTHPGDLVIIGPGVLNNRDGHDAIVRAVATRGATVLVMRQTCESVAGLALASRPADHTARIDPRHPILTGIDRPALESMLPTAEVAPLRLEVDDDATEVVWYAAPGANPTPLDALIAVKRFGAGRVIWCQVPLGDFERDPRAMMLMENLLAYAATRPEPTPRRSERGGTLILIPAGDRQIAVPGGVSK